MNSFVNFNTLMAGANNAHTENGAISYDTIGSELLNQFGKSASFRGRNMETVWDEQSFLWAENPQAALKFPFYLRMITRQTNILNSGKTEKVQRGAGVRDEAFKRLLWIAKYHPDEFYRNLWILPVVGSWKDLWVLLSYEGASAYLDEQKFFEVFAEGINDDNHRDLVKKYMPRIRSEKKCITSWAKTSNALAKKFAKAVGWTYKEYRDFKSTGKAHEFQTIICKGLYKNIDWKKIPGKALLNIVNGQFLEKHNLTNNYINWVKSQPVVKFNGYAFELARKWRTWRTSSYSKSSLAEKITIDKQFDNLIKTASKDNGAIQGNVLCALDTSASMTWETLDKAGTQPYDVCLSLGIYFSELNKGAFHNVVAEFSDKSRLMTLNGTFSDKYEYLQKKCCGYGSTNFQSLIDLIVDTRIKNPKMDIEEFPNTLLVVSDMQFNPAGGYFHKVTHKEEQSNYEMAMAKLKNVFPKDFVDNFKVIWWYCTTKETTDFPSTMDHSGTYMFSGYDGSVISFLLGGETEVSNIEKKAPSMKEIIETAFEQEVLSLVN